MTEPVTEPVTDPGPPPEDEEMTWDPRGDQLAAIAPQTVTSETPARGAQHPA